VEAEAEEMSLRSAWAIQRPCLKKPKKKKKKKCNLPSCDTLDQPQSAPFGVDVAGGRSQLAKATSPSPISAEDVLFVVVNTKDPLHKACITLENA
jgi:hypothetical protein